MKVLLLGANGRTGRLVMNQAIAMGHDVSVLVRHVGLSFPIGVRVIPGDALDAERVQYAMHLQDAVIVCIGGNAPWMNQTLEREAMQNIVSAMKKSVTGLLLVVSAMGVAESAKQSPWWYRYLLVPTFLRGITADKTAMEAIVRESGLDWIISRPPVLTDGNVTGEVRVLVKGEVGHMITRADLAMWLVEQLESRVYVGQAVVVVNS
ncbi:NAD(P)-dependent oxidoreductase [Pedobacter sp. L105]|uniref:NAD(P)-dependent oxidoreductase n=1 Tax=Pedobacter sp. L105 TaxID=1641871 RepID=UPI00131C876B|nr:NAD(P)H-binding protein [Pedobacter sp. L105]